MIANGKQEKIFIRHGRTHTQAMKSIQNWIHNHRDVFTDADRSNGENKAYHEKFNIDHERPNLTFHGLCHAFARETYHQEKGNGKSSQQARKNVSTLLGHGRDDVTWIYLG